MKQKKIIIISLTILVLIGLGYGVFYYLKEHGKIPGVEPGPLSPAAIGGMEYKEGVPPDAVPPPQEEKPLMQDGKVVEEIDWSKVDGADAVENYRKHGTDLLGNPVTEDRKEEYEAYIEGIEKSRKEIQTQKDALAETGYFEKQPMHYKNPELGFSIDRGVFHFNTDSFQGFDVVKKILGGDKAYTDMYKQYAYFAGSETEFQVEMLYQEYLKGNIGYKIDKYPKIEKGSPVARILSSQSFLTILDKISKETHSKNVEKAQEKEQAFKALDTEREKQLSALEKSVEDLVKKMDNGKELNNEERNKIDKYYAERNKMFETFDKKFQAFEEKYANTMELPEMVGKDVTLEDFKKTYSILGRRFRPAMDRTFIEKYAKEREELFQKAGTGSLETDIAPTSGYFQRPGPEYVPGEGGIFADTYMSEVAEKGSHLRTLMEGNKEQKEAFAVGSIVFDGYILFLDKNYIIVGLQLEGQEVGESYLTPLVQDKKVLSKYLGKSIFDFEAPYKKLEKK